MTLNAVIALILRFFSPNFTDFQADYITVVEDRPIMSVKYYFPVPVFYFWRKLSCTLQRGLSAIAEHLVFVNSRVCGVVKLKYAIRIFRGAKVCAKIVIVHILVLYKI